MAGNDYPLVDIEQITASRSKDVVFKWEGFTIWLKLSADAEPQPPGPHPEAVIAWLADVIEEWNLARGKKRLPVKRRVIKHLPAALVREMQKQVQAALGSQETETPSI